VYKALNPGEKEFDLIEKEKFGFKPQRMTQKESAQSVGRSTNIPTI